MGVAAGRRRVAVALGGLAVAATVAVTALAAGERTPPVATASARPEAGQPAQLLFVSQSTAAPGQPTDLTIELVQGEGLPGPRFGTGLVPASWELALDLPPNTAIGEFSAVVDIPILGVSNLELAGTLRTVAPADTDVSRAIECTGKAQHATVLAGDIDLSLPVWPPHASGQVFLDPASPANAALGYGYELRFCLRELTQLHVNRFTVVLHDFVTNAAKPGPEAPALLLTPYAVNGHDGNPAATVELRSLGGLQPELTLARVGPAKVKRGKTVRVQGRVLPGMPAAGRVVTIWAGTGTAKPELAGSAVTDAAGRFAFSTKAPKKKGTLRLLATYAAGGLDVTPTGCGGPNPAAAAGCVGATLGGLVSGFVTYRVA